MTLDEPADPVQEDYSLCTLATAPFSRIPDNALPDAEVYRNELRLAEMAEPLGFDSIWSVEHHFDDYTMCPDVLQFLSYMAGRTTTCQARLEAWSCCHGTIRSASPNRSRCSITSRTAASSSASAAAWRASSTTASALDQNEGRNLFVEYAELIIERARKRRTWKAANSHASRAARFVRVPCAIVQGPHLRRRRVARVDADHGETGSRPAGDSAEAVGRGQEGFRGLSRVWREVNGAAPIPKPISGGFCFVDENKDRAEELALKWIAANYHTVMKHYEMTSAGVRHQEELRVLPRRWQVHHQARHRRRRARLRDADAVGHAGHGAREVAFIRDTIDANGVMFNFSFGGMPYDDAERSIKCFAKYVLPELKKWNTEPLAEPAPIPSSAAAR